jgi:hypothetical protein
LVIDGVSDIGAAISRTLVQIPARLSTSRCDTSIRLNWSRSSAFVRAP